MGGERHRPPPAAQRVGGQDPKPVADIASTLDIGMLRAAEGRAGADPTPAAMVAIQPSTGDVLAVGAERRRRRRRARSR